MPSLAYTNGTWKQIMYDVNGKVRLITPVLEAGKEYALYVPKEILRRRELNYIRLS